MADDSTQATERNSLSSSTGVTSLASELGRYESSHMPSFPGYIYRTNTGFLTVFYSPVNPVATPPTALIPWTDDYETALASAERALHRHLDSGSTNRQRWLASRVQTSLGVRLAEFLPERFADLVRDPTVEFWLCEDHASLGTASGRSTVTILPIRHERAKIKDGVFYRFKVVTVGPMSVGKSMMLQYFTTPEERRLETLSATTGPKLDITNRFMTTQGVLVNVNLWDTAGQEKYRTLSRKYHYYGANGVFLVYSIVDAQSFRSCTEWLAEIRQHVDENVPIMLIGNQIDRVAERAVETSEAQAFALDHGLLFDEISGLEGINVERAFQGLAQEIFKGLKDRDELYEYKETSQCPGPMGDTSQSKSGNHVSSVRAMAPRLGFWEASKRLFRRSRR